MEYTAPQLTLVGSVSGVVLNGRPNGAYEIFPDVPNDVLAALESEW